MTHLFIPYELALKLKEKGFNEPCFGYYSTHNLNYIYHETIYSNVWENYKGVNIGLKAPLYQQVIDWLFEITGMLIVYNPADIKSVNKQIIQCLDKLESTK